MGHGAYVGGRDVKARSRSFDFAQDDNAIESCAIPPIRKERGRMGHPDICDWGKNEKATAGPSTSLRITERI
jgi:hypothetical protein